MNNGYRFILYSCVFILIVGGLMLFVFRDSLVDSWREQEGLMEVAAPSKITISAKDTLDPNILKNSRFTSLTNYVTDFNFDNICLRPDVVVSQPDNPDADNNSATGTPEEAASSTPLSCRQGNNLPFEAAKKK